MNPLVLDYNFKYQSEMFTLFKFILTRDIIILNPSYELKLAP
jgi:hypothetical protein